MKTARCIVASWVILAGVALAADDDTEQKPAQSLYESSIGAVIEAPKLTGAAGQGYLIYHKWCAGCHAPDFEPPEKDDSAEPLPLASQVALGTHVLRQRYQGAVPAELEKRKDLTAAAISHFVRHGLNAMPAFRKTEISDVELEALVAYLITP